ncbi:hypothetical protein BD413DRAFT_510993 [Trametes elegans]|nr:hypothetical protein BD413DRAFT_510993 [Trametes elegans]
MAEDMDMDAPQISTLREEASPEPNRSRSKLKLKLLVNEKSESLKPGHTSSKHARPDSDDDDDEDDDEEEDQLIDDDDDEVPKPAPALPPPVVAPTRGSPAKRGSRGRGGARRGRGGRGAAASSGPGVGVFETTPSESTSAQEPRAEMWDPMASEVIYAQPIPGMPAKKKPGPPKGATAQRAIRKKPSKTAKGTTALLLKDDAESVSEAYAGTAPSSPTPHDGSPEPDIPLASLIAHPVHVEEPPLEGIPLPVYPLPSKPFPVQPPPKIGTGFASGILLDKSGKPVRRWRQANREVRGIAGGRWFVKSWVGEKESEFATALAASQAAGQNAGDSASVGGLTLPKLSSVSVSGTGRGRGRGGRLAHDSSRAGSTMRGSGPGTPSVDMPPLAVSAPPAPQ